MIVIAGPPGSGKSSRFPLSAFGVEWFNADNRAAELNFGSFRKISGEIITFEQSRLAHEHGFWTSMDYVAAGSAEESIRRIIERSYRGGHSASERLVRGIYEKSIANLFTALDFAESGIELVRVYDNSEVGGHVRQA